MTQEEKQLLLIDLCARLPYHPIVHVEHNIGGFIETADLQVYGYEGKLKLLREDNETFCYIPIEECKPYLRPMSSMTYEEESKYNEIQGLQHWTVEDGMIQNDGDAIDWLNEKGFDFRGLIPMGLALETPEDMYK